ncbi:hypothetical protein [Alienimonas chondri]|uniref:Uncharacterized protein n=1 Tax=Alienimonas chondri TaxID=2681879 RepID=A0ABX1VIR1_9PLAN|nr:hypothetical protein [Alienimonas chondri]NNJ28004.1 hypothetical protein [Alienimonas chondri]
MAPDTEPTDEELHAVMVAARDAAVRREAISDAWTAARLAEAAAAVVADRAARESKTCRDDG